MSDSYFTRRSFLAALAASVVAAGGALPAGMPTEAPRLTQDDLIGKWALSVNGDDETFEARWSQWDGQQWVERDAPIRNWTDLFVVAAS